MQAMEEGLISIFMNAGANVLATSCGPCLGTGQGIPADGINIISTANRNFKGRMGTLQEEVRIGSGSFTDSGTSIGLGVGFSLALIQLELDITQIETDVTYLSVGVVF